MRTVVRIMTSAFVIASALVVGTSAGHASPITYDLSGTTVLNGNNETISGSFTFDAATDLETNVAITFAGASPYAGDYTVTSFNTGHNDELVLPNTTANHFDLTFASALDVASDALADVEFFAETISISYNAADFSPTGSATIPVAVSEPGSLALFGSAFMGLVFLGKRKRSGV